MSCREDDAPLPARTSAAVPSRGPLPAESDAVAKPIGRDAVGARARARIVRGLTAAVAVAAIACAVGGDVIVDGDPGFGFANKAALALGACAAILLLLPVRYAQRVLLVLGASALTLAAVEGGLRIFCADWFSSLYAFHPRRIYTHPPNARKRRQHEPVNGGKCVVTEINSEGFRGRGLREERSRRIVVYGDSYILAELTDLEATFAARLEARLQAKVPGVEVVNAGVSGYGPDQAGLRMEDELAALRPDLVVLALSGNDFGDLLRNKLFRLDGDGKLRENVQQLGEGLTRSLRRSDLYVLRALKKFQRRFQPKTHASVEHELKACRREYETYVKEGDNVVEEDGFGDHDDTDIRLEPERDHALYKKRLMEEMLRRIKDTVSNRGSTLVLLLIPLAVDACDNYEGRKVDAARYPAYRRSAITDAAAEAATQAGLPYVNLFPVFRTADADRLYLHGNDDHWNDVGQDLAAAAMVDYLLANDLIH